MKFLSGRVYHTLDEKKRIRIPSKFKSAFPEKERLYYVQYSPDCVTVMCESVFNSRMARFDDVTPDQEEKMKAMRRLISSVEDYSEDSYGRSAIPRSMLKAAKIEKDVITVGMGQYIEIWAREELERQDAEMSIREANRIAYRTAPEN